MNQFTTTGITLTRTDYGEADRIVTFLTPDHGKVRAMAKGVRRPKSKLAGGIELFSISDLTLIKGRGELNILASSRLKVHFGNIVTDITRTMLGYEMLKIMNKVLEDEGGAEYSELLKESLEVLNEVKTPIELAEVSFLMRLMRLLGHEPNLTTDVKGAPLEMQASYQFSYDDMGFFPYEQGTYSQNHIKMLRLLSHNSPNNLLKIADLGRYLGDVVQLVRQMSRQYVVSF